ncbi:urea transporter [Mycolicibacterium palauense]|uniref:urea transporter n=1 Tax=Mycolicibacterium palauense TaxID=2034511 RepID=UPI000BFED143|nr:urea transporter [Mycolicibacterium palauense]
MGAPGDSPVDPDPPDAAGQVVAYPRLVLRGISQLCFQSNELTGLCFLAAVLVVSPLAATYLLVAAILAPGARILLGERREVLATGLPGLNPCLIALSLPTFFQTGWVDVRMWIVLLVCVAATVLLVRVLLAVLPFPILALPFLLVFWLLYALAPHLSVALRPEMFDSSHTATLHPVIAVLFSLGQALFSPSVASGLLLTAGLLLSNWRHAVMAVLGAVIGTAVSAYYRHVDPTLADLGLYGFNGVLAAVAVYVFCGRLRLAILGALIASIATPSLGLLGLPGVSAPYVFATWFVLGLGWIERKWFTAPGIGTR